MPESPGLYLCLSVAENLECFAGPDELGERLFARSLAVRTLLPPPRPGPRPRRPPGRRRLAPGRLRRLPDRRLRPGRGRPRGHPSAGRGGRRRALHRRVPALARGRLPRADRRGCGGGPAVRMSARRVRAIFRKELREYRRNRRIVVSMAVLPLLFSVHPASRSSPCPRRRRACCCTASRWSTCWPSRRSSRPRSPPTRWPGNGSRPWRPRSSPARSCSPSCSSPPRGRLVDLGMHRHLDPVERPPGRHPAQHARLRSPDRRDHRHLGRRSPRDARPGSRPRVGAAAHRQPGLAARDPLFDRERLITGTRS